MTLELRTPVHSDPTDRAQPRDDDAPRNIDAARDVDVRHMARAIELAGRGWGRVHPNPMVGAVVTSATGAVVAEGWHGEFGGAHAEAAALARAGDAARGGTLYVTLEPCAHHGKTPPCTGAVVASGVGRVVIALRDPNPVAAGGLEHLRAAGIEVITGVGADAAADQNAVFLHWHATGRPYLALKLGMSLDGRISAHTGTATDVTGAAARTEAHRLRAGHDAILVGAETARIDDPLLTVRGPVEPVRPPLRIVLDSDARLSPESRLARDTQVAPTWLFAAPDAAGDTGALAARGVRVARARRAQGGGLDLVDVERTLAAANVRSVFCEGGGRLGSALLAAGLVERLYLFVAPKLFGVDAPAAFPATPAAPPHGGEPLPDRAGAAAPGDVPGARAPATRSWRRVRCAPFGDDVLIELARA